MSKDRELTKIVLKYNDGSEKEVLKGVVTTVSESNENDEVNLKQEMVGIGGLDIANIIYGMIHLGNKLGIFEDE